MPPVEDCCTYVVPYESEIQEPLDAPENLAVADITDTTASVSWDAVDDAEDYLVTLEPADVEPQETDSTSVELEGLQPDTEYTVSVVARGERPDSAAATETFTTDEENGNGD